VTATTDSTLPPDIGGVAIHSKLGEGGRSVVYAGLWQTRDVAIKVYKPRGIQRHAKRHPQNIADFEYQRNQALFNVPGLSRYIAEPLKVIIDKNNYALIQERLSGPLYYFYFRDNQGLVSTKFLQHLENILELAHRAEIYDVDIHAFNVIVDESGDEPIPKLFDFNLIPFHERPGFSLQKLGLKLGFISKAARDIRLLKNLNKVGRQEKKLIRYFR
jgi:serine/threonine protein kinase